MTAENNVALVRRVHDEVWSKGNLAAVDELFGQEFVGHPALGPTWRGREGVKAVVAMVRGAFPDWQETVQDVVAQGDKVVTRWISRGTHAGVFLGIAATGKRVTVAEMAMFRVTGGSIVEQWTMTDMLGLLQQLGAAAQHLSAGTAQARRMAR